ncbi:MAG: hypothetical protein AAF725_01160 [Acidobacteriota bacterium]
MGSWQNIGRISPRQLAPARLEIHHAAQLVAIAFARPLLPAQDDDRHTALTWLDIPGLWVSGKVPGSGGLRAGLRPAELVLTLGGKDDPAGAQLELEGRGLEEALAWLRERLVEHELEAERAQLDPHYELPDHPLASRGAAFSHELAAERAELAAYFGATAVLLAELTRENAGASPILTWPHHLDIATLIPAGESADGRPQSLGVGLSPGDGSYDEPYLYVSPWPFPEAADPAPLAVGRWHREGFHSAVLTATELLDGEDAESRARDFLAEALGAGRRILEADR